MKKPNQQIAAKLKEFGHTEAANALMKRKTGVPVEIQPGIVIKHKGVPHTFDIVERSHDIIIRIQYKRKEYRLGHSNDMKALADAILGISALCTLDDHFGTIRPPIPKNLILAFLDAALYRAKTQKIYGLPEISYWVELPPSIKELHKINVARMRILNTEEFETEPARARFSLSDYKSARTNGALYACMFAALVYEALVTRQESLPMSSVQKDRRVSVVPPGTARIPNGRRPISLTRFGNPHTDGNSDPVNPVGVIREPTYVISHMRRLPVGEASEDAHSHAKKHYLTIPDGYTFVRGYIRGNGSVSEIEYNLAEIAIETILKAR